MPNIKEAAASLWAQIPADWQAEIISAWHTFLTGAGAELGMDLAAHRGEPLSALLLKGLALAAIRAGVKALGQELWSLAAPQAPDQAPPTQ